MAWAITPEIDKTNQQYGVIATLPFNDVTAMIWQDTTNPPTLLDIEALRLELESQSQGFYSHPEQRIFAEIVNNAP